MKSFFDFIGRTEATRGARRWSWTILEVNFILSYFTKKKPAIGGSLARYFS
ncbi:hypothetical protein M3204_18685 [Mesobacillus subterraneus]|uniref:hypothetical protein n=1 Tax=Mesobacillus subterraneus TaxID=285983 RepID=UPI00203B81E0|nr:hypothetical protein [Mesobacillus subterraneus]MCM3666449.1 hypothetical protein [Mesobacillus subterraneus]MCM3685448.1 hypothetical protein [Mesobacillus subterraneus]